MPETLVVLAFSGGGTRAAAFSYGVLEARDVQGELIARAVNPFNWTNLASTGWGRSEMAAGLYDQLSH